MLETLYHFIVVREEKKEDSMQGLFTRQKGGIFSNYTD